MENKKQKNDFKITLYKSIKFIAWITLGFVIGGVLRYKNVISLGITAEKVMREVSILFLPGISSFIALLLWLISLILPKLLPSIIMNAIFIGILTGSSIGIDIAIDATVNFLYEPLVIFGVFFAGIFGAIFGVMLIAGVVNIFIFTLTHKKKIINMFYAIAIGFTIGFTVGHILVFSILGLI